MAQKDSVPYSTASMALSGKGQISQKKRDRVLQAATDLGYIKQVSYSSSLSKIYDTRVAVLLHIDSSWIKVWGMVEPILTSIESVLWKKKYNPVLVPIMDYMTEEIIFNKIMGLDVDAVFSIWDVLPKLFKRFESNGLAVIIINNDSFQGVFPTVCQDNFQGTYEATSYLTEQGHKNFKYIDYYREDGKKMVRDRYLGFYQAYKEAFGEESEANIRFTCNIDDPESVVLAVRRFFADPEHVPDGLVVHDDFLALKIYKILDDFGLSIPEDVSLIAHGDVYDYNQPFIPGITTMQANSRLLGELAADLFLKIRQNANITLETIRVTPVLAKRQSCLDRRGDV